MSNKSSKKTRHMTSISQGSDVNELSTTIPEDSVTPNSIYSDSSPYLSDPTRHTPNTQYSYRTSSTVKPSQQHRHSYYSNHHLPATNSDFGDIHTVPIEEEEVAWDQIGQVNTFRDHINRYRNESFIIGLLICLGVICLIAGIALLAIGQIAGGVILLFIGIFSITPGGYFLYTFYQAYQANMPFVFRLPKFK